MLLSLFRLIFGFEVPYSVLNFLKAKPGQIILDSNFISFKYKLFGLRSKNIKAFWLQILSTEGSLSSRGHKQSPQSHGCKYVFGGTQKDICEEGLLS